jgi:coniferyl-aldehyde dehydrogenase
MGEIIHLSDQDAANEDRLTSLLAAQRKAFHAHAPLDHRRRIEALKALHSAVIKFEAKFVRALSDDFGNRARQETLLLEIFPTVEEIRHIRRKLKGWMRPRSSFANWSLWPSRTRIIYQPLGVVGIIAPWNYPIFLTLAPLANALAAGNHVMIKPSELAPATADVLAKLISETFSEDHVCVVRGGSDVSATFSALPFDHLLFTGSTRVGKLVMGAAAKNLTPVTLELGGKSPALVHPDFPLDIAADRICSAKLLNAGQTCVAPDYALIARDKADEFVAAAQMAMVKRYPSLEKNADYTHMISRAARERMAELVNDAKEKGARTIQPYPGVSDDGQTRIFAPTLVLDVHENMCLMQEEIFGPVLPIVTYQSLDDAIAFINAHPRPLALYYFDYDRSRIDRILNKTTSGGVTVNDCMLHVAQSHLPFGGVGPSGIGAYHGFTGFKTFSHQKSVLLESSLTGRLLDKMMRPPYNGWSNRMIRFLIGRAG